MGWFGGPVAGGRPWMHRALFLGVGGMMLAAAGPAGGAEGSAAGWRTGPDPHPFRDRTIWLPMTGFTDEQIAEAAAAGYDTVLLKIHPPFDGEEVDFAEPDGWIDRMEAAGLKAILAILGWVALPADAFWDVKEDGGKIPGRLDPFRPEAMERIERYFADIIDHYAGDPRVLGFAPTWGIYGEAGFSDPSGGRSPHALQRFNEWLEKQGLPPLERLPDRRKGPNTDYNRFIRFRYLYLQDRFDGMVRRLKTRAGGRPVGMWQELYPVAGYLWTMVRVPSADFALYESCFTFQTSHDPERTLGETMGFRYRCRSAEDYRDYYLPLLARKRGEGQRFMGCQLSNDYALNYGWTIEEAREREFDRWEDRFCPTLRELMSVPLERPRRDVLLIFPTYAAAALSDNPANGVDAWLIDTLLRMYGCSIDRYGSPRLDGLAVEEMNRYRLIVVPASAYLLTPTLERLVATSAHVLFTGRFAEAMDGVQTPPGGFSETMGLRIGYGIRPAGRLERAASSPLTEIDAEPPELAEDESFRFVGASDEDRPQVLLRCAGWPVLSAARGGRRLFLHGQVFAAACRDPARKPRVRDGSKDASANEIDPWGPYSAEAPGNAYTLRLMGRILESAGVEIRVPDPEPRGFAPYLGDNLERASISANIVYNNTAEPRHVKVRLPWKPAGVPAEPDGDHWLAVVEAPPFGYVALQPDGGDPAGRLRTSAGISPAAPPSFPRKP